MNRHERLLWVAVGLYLLLLSLVLACIIILNILAHQ